jgi:hypothetical protein
LAGHWKALKRRPVEFLSLSCWDETDWAASRKEQEVAVTFETTAEESSQLVAAAVDAAVVVVAAAAAASVPRLICCFPLRYERQVTVAWDQTSTVPSY